MSNKTKSASNFKKGKKAIKTSKTDEALEYLKKSISFDPKNEEAIKLLVQVLLKEEQVKEAETQIRKCIKLHPDSSVINELAGDIFLRSQEIDKSIKYYERSHRLCKKHKEGRHQNSLYNKLGDVYLSINDLKKAKRSFRKAIKSNPRQSQGYKNLGFVYDREGGQLKALEQYQKALDLEANYENMFNVAYMLKTLGRYHDALTILERSLEIDKNRSESFNLLGEIYQELGRLKEAQNSFETSIRLNPDYCEAYYNLGIIENEIKKSGELSEIERQCRYEIVLNLREERSSAGFKSYLDPENVDEFILDQNKWMKQLQTITKDQINKRVKECYEEETRKLLHQFRRIKQQQRERFEIQRGKELSQFEKAIFTELENEQKKRQTELLNQLMKDLERETKSKMKKMDKQFNEESKLIENNLKLPHSRKFLIQSKEMEYLHLSKIFETGELNLEFENELKNLKLQKVKTCQQRSKQNRKSNIQQKKLQIEKETQLIMNQINEKYTNTLKIKKENFKNNWQQESDLEIEKIRIKKKSILSKELQNLNSQQIKEQIILYTLKKLDNKEKVLIENLKKMKLQEKGDKISEITNLKDKEIEKLNMQIQKLQNKNKKNKSPKENSLSISNEKNCENNKITKSKAKLEKKSQEGKNTKNMKNKLKKSKRSSNPNKRNKRDKYKKREKNIKNKASHEKRNKKGGKIQSNFENKSKKITNIEKKKSKENKDNEKKTKQMEKQKEKNIKNKYEEKKKKKMRKPVRKLNQN